jgi:hypothetical protein
MNYDTVEINPAGGGQWRVTFSSLPGDREEVDHKPSALGFFHYPREWGRAKGLRVLREHMIKRHVDEIEALQKSLEALRDL